MSLNPPSIQLVRDTLDVDSQLLNVTEAVLNMNLPSPLALTLVKQMYAVDRNVQIQMLEKASVELAKLALVDYYVSLFNNQYYIDAPAAAAADVMDSIVNYLVAYAVINNVAPAQIVVTKTLTDTTITVGVNTFTYSNRLIIEKVLTRDVNSIPYLQACLPDAEVEPLTNVKFLIAQYTYDGIPAILVLDDANSNDVLYLSQDDWSFNQEPETINYFSDLGVLADNFQFC